MYCNKKEYSENMEQTLENWYLTLYIQYKI